MIMETTDHQSGQYDASGKSKPEEYDSDESINKLKVKSYQRYPKSRISSSSSSSRKSISNII